jgi:hypothetical protein
VVVTDPMEEKLPDVGLIMFEDVESGEVVEFDTSGPGAERYRRRIVQLRAQRDHALRRMNTDIVEVRTDQPYVDALVAFFKARARRIAHG